MSEIDFIYKVESSIIFGSNKLLFFIVVIPKIFAPKPFLFLLLWWFFGFIEITPKVLLWSFDFRSFLFALLTPETLFLLLPFFVMAVIFVVI